MTLLLVRHGVAERRRDWKQADHLRPLTAKGQQQAEGLVDVLAEYGVRRICSSPYLRCVQTVEPLAAKLGLAVEQLDELADGADDDACRLVPGLAGETTVFCTHGDVVPALLSVLAPRAVRGRADLPLAKGSTWVVDLEAQDASYLEPPS
jgi:8-oxo-dGTP diphosphatase